MLEAACRLSCSPRPRERQYLLCQLMAAFMHVRTASLQQRPHTQQSARPGAFQVVDARTSWSRGALGASLPVSGNATLEWSPSAILPSRPQAASRSRPWAPTDGRGTTTSGAVPATEMQKCRTPQAQQQRSAVAPSLEAIALPNRSVLASCGALRKDLPSTNSESATTRTVVDDRSDLPSSSATSYASSRADHIKPNEAAVDVPPLISECNSDGVVYSKLLSDDRDRHRRELDLAWRREKALHAKVTELQQQLCDFRKQDREVRRQLAAMLEAVARSEMQRREGEGFARLLTLAHSAVVRLACTKVARPPVRDSELLRALKRAERRIAQLEGHTVSEDTRDVDARRPGTTPASIDRWQRMTHIAETSVNELEAFDESLDGRKSYRPFLSTVIR